MSFVRLYAVLVDIFPRWMIDRWSITVWQWQKAKLSAADAASILIAIVGGDVVCYCYRQTNRFPHALRTLRTRRRHSPAEYSNPINNLLLLMAAAYCIAFCGTCRHIILFRGRISGNGGRDQMRADNIQQSARNGLRLGHRACYCKLELSEKYEPINW